MSLTVETAKMILEHLQTVVPAALCRRSYLPVADIEELEESGRPIVLVCPVERRAEKFNQGGARKNDFVVDIAVNAKLFHAGDTPESQVAEIDTLMEIAETVHDSFLKKIVISAGPLRAACGQPEHLILSDIETIQERNCFLSVIRVNAEVYHQREGVGFQ